MSSEQNYTVVVDVHDMGDDYCMSIFNRFDALFVDEVNLRGFDSSIDLFPELHGLAAIDTLEIVGHGSPFGCSIFDSCNLDVIGPLLQDVMSDSGKVILNGCNTGCFDGGFCIGRDLATVSERAVLGTKGYVHGGTYYENNNRCSVDNDGVDPPYSGSTAAKRKGVYRKFMPSDDVPATPTLCPETIYGVEAMIVTLEEASVPRARASVSKLIREIGRIKSSPTLVTCRNVPALPDLQLILPEIGRVTVRLGGSQVVFGPLSTGVKKPGSDALRSQLSELRISRKAGRLPAPGSKSL